jgi:hypothetical protein
MKGVGEVEHEAGEPEGGLGGQGQAQDRSEREPDAATHAGAEKAGHEGGERGRRGQGGERRLGPYRSRRSMARAVRAHSLSRAGTGA